jgi:hypothetical protein
MRSVLIAGINGLDTFSRIDISRSSVKRMRICWSLSETSKGDALKILICQSCIDVITETNAKISPTGRARPVTSSHDQGDRAPKDILELRGN